MARLCDMPEYHTPEGMPPLLPAIFLCWIQYTNVFLSMLHGSRWNAGKHRLNRHHENTGVHDDSRTSHTNTEVHKLVLLGPGQCCLLHDTIPHILDLDLSTIHSRGSSRRSPGMPEGPCYQKKWLHQQNPIGSARPRNAHNTYNTARPVQRNHGRLNAAQYRRLQRATA